MKLLNFIIVSLFFLCACEDNTPSRSLNSFSAWVNNDHWIGTTEFATAESSDTLTIFGIMDQPEGYFWMRIKFEGPRVYSLTRNQVGYSSTIGRDVFTSYYMIDPDKPGTLTISSVDPFGVLDGTFGFELKKERGTPDSEFPEVFNVRSGNLKGFLANP